MESFVFLSNVQKVPFYSCPSLFHQIRRFQYLSIFKISTPLGYYFVNWCYCYYCCYISICQTCAYNDIFRCPKVSLIWKICSICMSRNSFFRFLLLCSLAITCLVSLLKFMCAGPRTIFSIIFRQYSFNVIWNRPMILSLNQYFGFRLSKLSPIRINILQSC